MLKGQCVARKLVPIFILANTLLVYLELPGKNDAVNIVISCRYQQNLHVSIVNDNAYLMSKCIHLHTDTTAMKTRVVRIVPVIYQADTVSGQTLTVYEHDKRLYVNTGGKILEPLNDKQRSGKFENLG